MVNLLLASPTSSFAFRSKANIEPSINIAITFTSWQLPDHAKAFDQTPTCSFGRGLLIGL